MKIKSISIKKFRGFKNVKFELGSDITIISGQNGTQKTTLLGLLTQPFTITDRDNPMYGEKPLSGGDFKSGFSDKFKLSHYKFDKPKEHEWTLFFDNDSDFTVESIKRNDKEIRFWKKGDRSKGAGYVQLPVIYLSLKRLLPIGEDKKINENKILDLTNEEKEFYADWHNKILILTRDKDRILNATSLESPDKQTLGANTSYYDWQSNSAGQDNIGKILLAILSFKRLKEKYPNDYKGGVLAIDEVDTTFYPGSQIRLLRALSKFVSKFNIQIIFTTHSLTLLEEASKYQSQEHQKDKIKIAFLRKQDESVIVKNNIDYEYIKNSLNRTLTGKVLQSKIDVYTEDKETEIFAKSLLGQNITKKLKFIQVSLGCGNLIDLASRKVPSFVFPNSIIILDGDVKRERKQMNRIKLIKNIILLPTEKSPEQIIAEFLNNLSDTDFLWQNIDNTFDHQYCFEDTTYEEILKDRNKAKKWFNSHLNIWGRNATKVLTPWKNKNLEIVNQFKSSFSDLISKF